MADIVVVAIAAVTLGRLVATLVDTRQETLDRVEAVDTAAIGAVAADMVTVEASTSEMLTTTIIAIAITGAGGVFADTDLVMEFI